MLKIGIIGIYKNLDEGEFSRLSFKYSKQVEDTGIAMPYIIPSNIKNIQHYIDECDAFIIPGGEDIDPRLYGAGCLGSIKTEIQNDNFELGFIKEAVDCKKPIFGICRGMQLLNVFFGGTLQQHIDSDTLHQQKEKQNDIVHEVYFSESSRMHAIFGASTGVNSIHHQAIKKLGNDLKITGRSDDGIIEAIEHTGLNITGVQWHPEMLAGHALLFRKLFESYK